MPVFGASDVRVMIRDMGVVVVVGAITTRGLVDAVDEDMLKAEFPHLIGKVRDVTMDRTEAGVAAAVATKGDITVDGVAYKIHSFASLDDEGLLRVTVVKVN